MNKIFISVILLISSYLVNAGMLESELQTSPAPIPVDIEAQANVTEQMNPRAITKKLVYAQAEDVVQNLTPTISEPKATFGATASMGQGARENTKPFSRVSDFSADSRFESIKVDPEVAKNEIDFWARQMSEHALFAHLGLEDPDLKDKALQTHLAFEDFRKKFNQNPDDLELMNSILPLLKEERKFQIAGLQALDEGKWIGWVFPLFLNHITLELDYFVDKLNGIKYSPEDEVLFWNRINSEHAAFAAHLLDPSERKLFLQADKMSTKFMHIPKSEREMFIRISLKFSKQLDAFNKKAQAEGKAIKSIIHPVLLAHVIREGERSIETLTKLGLHKQAGRFARQYRQQVEDYRQ